MITFKYKKEKSDLLGTIYRPVAEVGFKDKDGNLLVSFMYIDSGADITLIPRALGESLGLQFDEKEIEEIKGVGAATVPIIIRKMWLKLGKHEFEARIAWALEENVPPLLGRLDIFNRFEVRFKEKEKVVQFMPAKL
jgi:hypothetical protein